MNFRLRTDAKKWFSEVSGRSPFKTAFDVFYFCLIAGLVSGRHNELGQSENSSYEITDNFTEEFRAQRNLIIGLLILADLRAHGIDVHEKQSVRNTIQSLLDPHTQTGLSDLGVRLMNEYSSGGCDYLAERRAKPFLAEEFLRDFVQLVDSAVTSGPLVGDLAVN
ncbi:hypothetical protein [Rhizomicrobium electricum]|uniref:Dnd system-associated protein 4 n=1 Tax=Rhizomicrobium electricum TaxID=480070 RepID=A0ABP3Q5K2_9PROT|nr:hypothetical protein [Rhizomicrobium electricum]NIJ50366.1 hypothetical protein [Rhizomicrobium electricum]